MRAVRVTGQTTEVKQLKTKANSKMGDHLGSIYFMFVFQFGYDWQTYYKFAKCYCSGGVSIKLNCLYNNTKMIEISEFKD